MMDLFFNILTGMCVLYIIFMTHKINILTRAFNNNAKNFVTAIRANQKKLQDIEEMLKDSK